jgi:hypothetical protein
MNKSFLWGLLYFLSLTVIIESVYIIGYFVPKSDQETSRENIPSQLVGEIIQTPETQTDLPSPKNYKAKIWLKSEQNGEEIKVDIWLDSQKGLSFSNIKLFFDPTQVDILDQDPNQEGIQLALGQAPVYLQNTVDTQGGVIELSAQLEPNIEGQIQLASIYLRKADPDKSINLDFEYYDDSLQGSFVVSQEEKLENVLEKPEGIKI